MTTVKQFRGQVEARPGVTLQTWIMGYVESVIGLGKESFTYLGCSKKIALEGCMAWFGRKRLGDESMTLAEEYVNHHYVHGGNCCQVESGIQCFALSVNAVDHSATLKAEVWALAMHLLGMKPNTWLGLDKKQQTQYLRHLSDWPFEMLLMSVYVRGDFSHYKVHFVKPAAYDPKLIELGTLATKLESLGVVEDKDEHSICMVGAEFAPPLSNVVVCDKMKAIVKLISNSYSLNVRAVIMLHELMWEFPSCSGP